MTSVLVAVLPARLIAHKVGHAKSVCDGMSLREFSVDTGALLPKLLSRDDGAPRPLNRPGLGGDFLTWKNHPHAEAVPEGIS